MSLDLDPRQRAMLEEMHVRVWSPLTQAAAATPATLEATTEIAAPTEGAPPVQAPRERAAATVRAASADTATMPLQPRAAAVQTMDWAALQQAVADCRACALCNERKHTVFGMGGLTPQGADQPPVADWLIVGEAPGEQEDLSGLPFVGPAGQLLDNMLKAIGLDRNRQSATAASDLAQAARGCFIANVLKCRPPSNRNPEGAEVAQCVPYLQRQIELLQPKIILAMGRFAAQTLLHETVPDVLSIPLGKLRGQVHQYRGIPVVVTYHPAYLLRALGDKAKAWGDLCLAMQVRQDAA